MNQNLDDDLNKASQPPPPPPGYPPPLYPQPPVASRSKGVVSRMLTALVSTVLIVSLCLNVYALLWVMASTAGPREQTYQAGDVAQRIVIVPIKGLIDDDTTGFVRQALDSLKADPPQAVILRVDSGGGMVGASDRVWYALTKFKEQTQIPIVASFGSYAASGGYYVAAPADHIFVEPTTITGSIGVMGGAFTAERLLNMIGVKPEILVATGSPEKDVANTSWRTWTEKDRQTVRRVLDQAYDRFVEVVALGRQSKLTVEQVKELATGKVYTAAEAIENKLVDENGYLDSAIDKAAQLAGISPSIRPHVTVIAPSRSPLDMLLGGRLSSDVPASAEQLRRAIEQISATRVEYRMPPLQ